MDNLSKLKILLNIQDTTEDAMLDLMLEQAKEFILNYCNLTSVPVPLTNTHIMMAQALYNTAGIRGLSSENVGGISTTTSGIITPDIAASLNRYANRVKIYAPKKR